MEHPLSCSLDEQAAIQEAIVQDLQSDNWQKLEAAIFISGTTYLYKRKVDEQPQRFTYKCLSPDALNRAFHLERIDSGWLSPDIVRCGSTTHGDWAVMFIPPSRHRLILPNTRRMIPLPGLVLVGLGTTYRLWAVATPAFDPQALAYQAPLPNVYDNGIICWGTNTAPVATPQTLPQAWHLFITSPFSSHLVSGKSRAHSTTILAQLMCLNRHAAYPSEDLVPVPVSPQCRTIAPLIERYLQL